MRSGLAKPGWRIGALVVLFCAVALPRTVAAAPTDAACTDPPPTDLGSARPDQLRERYHLDQLFADGHDGRGQIGVVLEFGQSVDTAALDNWGACLDAVPPPITQTLVGEGTMPLPGGEAQADAQSMTIGAPGLDRIYALVVNGSEAQMLPTLLEGILDASLTGGRRAAVVSLSFGSCEQQWVADGEVARIRNQIEPGLQRLAEAGIWFFKAGGDAGSSDCSPHDSNPNCVSSSFAQQLAVGYPASSPWVTSVGGTELLDGVEGDATVWNARQRDPADCSGGAGYLSSLFERPAYQDVVPNGAVPAMRGVPDVTALGGSPGYLSYDSISGWYGNAGTSYAAPLYAGAAASVRSALVAAGVELPTVFNAALYDLASDPSVYDSVFDDITVGNNIIYEANTCCFAAVGYDLASGLGELHAAELADALAIRATIPTSTTTSEPTESTAPRFTG